MRESKVSDRELRKGWRLQKRQAHQVERARIRDELKTRMHDPETLQEIVAERATRKRAVPGGEAKREWTLQARKRRVRAELKSKQDLGEFIRDMAKSKTLHSLIALGFFRHVLHSEEYPEDHRYKIAIHEAMRDPPLLKVLKRRWDELDRTFPGRDAGRYW